MREALAKLKEAHALYGHPVGTASLLERDQLDLRLRLIEEECMEFQEAIGKYLIGAGGRREIYKELGDLLYVVLGFAVTFDIPLDVVFDRIHKSNMSKVGDDGKPIYRKDGKVIKGPNYRPPDLSDL